MRTTNWIIMARNDSTMTLFLNVTNANLTNDSVDIWDRISLKRNYLGNMSTAISARLSMPISFAQIPEGGKPE